MLSGHEAVQIYRKGIQVLDADFERHTTALNATQAALVKRQSASALASIAELYMTVPLCDEINAEQTCEQSLQEALIRDGTNLDALQCLANLRILRDRDNEAKDLLRRVVDQTLLLQDEHKKQTTVSELVKGKKQKDLQEMPSVQFRMQTSRQLVEMQMDKQALKILEGVISEDDEVVEAWYLLAFVLHRMAKFSTCLECANNVVTLA